MLNMSNRLVYCSVQYSKMNVSINNITSNSKFLNKEIGWFKALNYNKLQFKFCWNFELQFLQNKEGFKWHQSSEYWIQQAGLLLCTVQQNECFN